METTAQSIPRMTAEEYFAATAETTQPQELLDGEIVALAAEKGVCEIPTPTNDKIRPAHHTPGGKHTI